MSNNLILNGKQLLEQILEDKVIDLNNPSCNNCNECWEDAIMSVEFKDDIEIKKKGD